MSNFIIIKLIVSAVVIILITETAKRNVVLGGLFAAMPINILISISWLYIEKKDLGLLSNFAISILWGVIPTLLFILPAIYLFKKEWNFMTVIPICLCSFAIGAYFHQRILN